MDYTQLQKEYGGEYVALLKDKVVAHGKTFGEALAEIKSLNLLENEELSFRYIHPIDAVCVYYITSQADEPKNIECEKYGSKRLRIFDTNIMVPEIVLPTMTKSGYRKAWFLVDTGADVTSFPSSAKELFEQPVEACEEKMYGFEGIGANVSKSFVNLKICGEETRVRCIFSEMDNIPFLIGRLDVLDKFNIMFYEDKVCFERRADNKEMR